MKPSEFLNELFPFFTPVHLHPDDFDALHQELKPEQRYSLELPIGLDFDSVWDLFDEDSDAEEIILKIKTNPQAQRWHVDEGYSLELSLIEYSIDNNVKEIEILPSDYYLLMAELNSDLFLGYEDLNSLSSHFYAPSRKAVWYGL